MANFITNITELDEILDSLTEELIEDEGVVKKEDDVPTLTGPFFSTNSTQNVLISHIKKIIKHVVVKDKISYLVTFDTDAFGGNRWFRDHCLFRRSMLIVKYWSKKTINAHREMEDTTALYNMNLDTFSVYDF